MFQQVLLNLLNNAIKFSYPGGRVTLSVLEKSQRVVFRVEDEGLGFEPNAAEELFEKFTSKGRKGTADEPSIGMGLYLARRIVAKHHGKLSASSEGAGKGSVFQIEI